MSLREDLKIPLTMLSVNFLNKLPYKGSYKGKRFLFERCANKDDLSAEILNTNDLEVLKENFILKVYLWKDVFCFEKTDTKDMKIKEFEYSKQGIEAGIDFVEATSV